MNVIVHYPASCDTQKILAEKVASVHTQAVLHKLQTLSCPKEQKLQLIKAIKEVSVGHNII